MSNYIYNNFDNDNDENLNNLNILYRAPQRKRTISVAMIVCTALMVISGFMFLIGGSLNFLSSAVTSSKTPEVTNNTTYVSAEKQSSTTLLANTDSRVSVIARIKDSVVEIKTTAGSGSGVIVGKFDDSNNEKGYYIITNSHVIEGASTNMYAPATITLTDGTEYKSTLCGFDTKSDIAVLKIKETERELTCAVWANEESELMVGEEVIVIGNPLGELGGTVTNGYLSALDREITVGGVKMNLLQTDAAVNPGNSGGGLFNRNGELIGIVNAKIADEDVEGIGFAIPYKDAIKVYNDLKDFGYVTGRPTIGIQIKTNRFGRVEVVSAGNGSPLRAGDIITGIKLPGSNTFVSITTQELSNAVENMEIGETFELEIVRNYKELIVSVTTYEYNG
ncbi:MAG: trypsin-like peptidase domain-containing protein [Clostridia bacterium]|nr:trypsin-like peptidase domain-containing protein [Clostridia bacterium]